MKRLLLAVVIAATSLVSGGGASASSTAVVPAVLIVQETTPSRYGQNFDIPVTSQIAQEFDTEGRVTSIVWSLTDPVFRAAVDDEIIKKPSTNPKNPEIQAVAQALKAEYVLWVKAVRDRTRVEAEVKLYRVGKVVWQDKKDLSITSNDAFDADAAAESLARTWCMALGAGEFKNLPTTRRETPVMDPGTRRPVVVPDPPAKVDNKQLALDAAELAKSGQTAQLIVLLRDAVDSEPFDAGRRRMLIDYLLSAGKKQLAAEEAKRSALLLPESAEFHVLAARAYMESGNDAQAQAELNEAIAREPGSFETRLLLGELALLRLDVKVALENLNAALEKGTTPDALFKRALANALAGNADAAGKDFEACVKEGELPQLKDQRYAFVVELSDRAVVDAGTRIRALIQTARLKPGNADLKAEAKSLVSFVAGLQQLVAFPARPEKNETSHLRRDLALNLLAQCVAQIETSIKDKDVEMLAEATINLGEALKHAAAAKEAYQSETQSSAG